MSYDPTRLPQHDCADWFLYLIRIFHKRTYEERFTILSIATVISIQASYEMTLTREQIDVLTNKLAVAYEYHELDLDESTAHAALVMSFLSVR